MRKIILFILILSTVVVSGCFFGNDEEASGSKQAANNNKEIEVKASDKQIEENLLTKYNMAQSFILIDKTKFRVEAIDDTGKIVASYPCALGKNSGQKEKEGDMKTPYGTFPIDEIIDASSWTHDFKDGKGEIAGAYGPWFISLDTTGLSKGQWGGIGIHGTHDPNSIGKRVSEGCIRLTNEDIQKLKDFAKVGMKVVIIE
ncbi:L,D-transpeptidase [uncultured Phascolarctobacterium sp.]|uniref:L,D-transpeptidase n=1 Tax=uncultured Phascolarctobacterium sp. TaxID=512296 RepID=UPI0025F90A51|nr:L,D-transpeptidase [uncultured Phascolarctobacterium sp.]